MSDWRERAKPVGAWRANATPVDVPVAREKPDTSIEDAVGEFAQPFKAGADTYSMGLLPRALAVGDTLAQTFDPRGPKLSEALDTYDSNLTKRQKDSRETARNYPSASIGGGFIPGPAWLGKGLSLAQRLAAAGGTGAAAGNLMAPHDDPEARMKGTLLGGAAALGFQGLNEASGPLAQRFSGATRQKGGEMATNVMVGGKAGIGDRLTSAGVDPAEASAFGNRALDEGLIPTGLNPFEPPVVSVMNRARKLSDEQGKKIGESLATADAAAPFEPSRAQKEVIAGTRPRNPLEADKSVEASKLIDRIGQLTAYPEGNTFAGANRMKSQTWKAINHRETVPMEMDRLRQANGKFRDAIRDQVSDVAGDQVASDLTKANDRFGFAETVDELASPAASRGGQAQKFGTISDAVADPGSAAGKFVGGILKGRGPTALARAYRLMSEGSKAFTGLEGNAIGAGESGGAAASLVAGEDEENLSNLKKRFGK